MKRLLLLALIIVVAAGSFLAGRMAGRQSPVGAGIAADRKILYYVDPMNPAHTSDQPGKAPCGMDMEPVYADLSMTGVKGGPLLPGTVTLTPDRQQLIGVRLGTAEKKPVRHTVRLLGKVVADETRTYQITAPAEGWVTKAMPVTAGSHVKKDDVLAMFYSPTFISAGQAFRNALEYQDRMQTNQAERSIQRPGLAEFNVKQYSDSLRNLGVSDRQINEMIQTRKYSEHIDIVSPAEGFVSARNISMGQRFEKGAELYRIVDLTRVWILADVFDRDAPLVQPGSEAMISLPGRHENLPARLSDALPQFDPVSRTLKLRFEAQNPDFVFKADMFVDVQFEVTFPETLVVPADAVLDSGTRKVIFVARGSGVFEPRPVLTGWRVGDQVQVLQGIMPGERLVISGNFLLDSESRMKLAASGVHGIPLIDPVCGMAVDENKARAGNRVAEYGGRTYLFCNDGCKKDFEANPARFLSGPGPGDTMTPEPVAGKSIDPVCGMAVTQAKARSANRFVDYQGQTYYFCNDSCKEEFQEDPAKFLKSAPPHPEGQTHQTPRAHP